jgi:hypothetical protein
MEITTPFNRSVFLDTCFFMSAPFVPLSASNRGAVHRTALLAILLLFCALTALYGRLGLLAEIGGRVKAYDSAYYYMYVRSMVMDRDLDFTNEITRMIGKEHAEETRVPKTGLPENNMAIGAALFWTPFFLLGHLATLLVNALGRASLPLDGYSTFYQSFVYIGNALYVAAGLCLSILTYRRFVSERAALFGAAATLLVTPLSYYVWSLTPLAHNVSFFAVSLFLYAYITRGLSIPTALTAGLMFLARWQDILYAAPLLIDGTLLLGNALRGRDANARRQILELALAAGAFVLLVSLQFVCWKILFGDYILVPPHSQQIDPLRMHPLSSLFNAKDGILSWHPLLALGFGGLFLLWPRKRKLVLSCVGVLLLQFMFIASLQWSAGGTFGMRFFVGGLPFFGLGFALLYERMRSRAWKRWTSLLVLTIAAVWNLLFVYQYAQHLVSHVRPLEFQDFVTDKLRIVSVSRSEELFLEAREAFLRNDVPGFLALSKQAYELDPRREKRILAHALACLLAGELTSARARFEELLAEHPGELLYRIGLAECLLANGNPLDAQRAWRLFSGQNEQEAELRRRIEDPSPPLDADFFRKAFQRLAELHH